MEEAARALMERPGFLEAVVEAVTLRALRGDVGAADALRRWAAEAAQEEAKTIRIGYGEWEDYC